MNEIIKQTNDIAQNRAEIGYTTPILLQALLPYRNPETTLITRSNGNNFLHIQSANGIPYGRYVRYIMAYLTTQAFLRSKDLPAEQARVIPLGNTFNDFLRSIGLNTGSGHTVNGQTIKNIREQLQRLGALSIIFEERIPSQEREKMRSFRIIAEQDFHYGTDPNQGQLFEPHITLDRDFFDIIADKGIPFSFAVLTALKKPVSMDFYLWATYSVFPYKNLELSWDELHSMFGTQYRELKDFKKEFKKAVSEVAEKWAGFQYEFTPNGLTLPAQKPSVTPSDMPREQIKEEILKALEE